MTRMLSGGGMVDLIVALVLVEAFAVLGWRAITGRGPAPLPFVSNLLAGTFLLLALRNALNGVAWTWIAACLLAALVAHLADLRLRWESAGSSTYADRRPDLNATISLRISKSNVRGAGGEPSDR